MFVIHKNSRIPTDVSYSGQTWDTANLRSWYREQYYDLDVATALACLLSKYNAVGFSVKNISKMTNTDLSCNSEYEFVDILSIDDDFSRQKYNLEYGDTYEYESLDGKYVAEMISQNHERDSSGDYIFVYKRRSEALK